MWRHMSFIVIELECFQMINQKNTVRGVMSFKQLPNQSITNCDLNGPLTNIHDTLNIWLSDFMVCFIVNEKMNRS